MSAPNGGMMIEGETFFTSVQRPFPDLSSDGKIDTVQFLEASKGVVALVELFGKTFTPVKIDMNGNIEKLTQQYNKNKEKFSTLDDMIIAEKEEKGNFATDALLWLKRALHFFQVFLQGIIQDATDGKNSESLAPFLKEAYRTTLEKYHGWMTQQLFSLLSRVCSSRKDLLQTMSLGHEGRESIVLRDMQPFVNGIQKIVQAIDNLYIAQGLDLNVKA